MCHYDCGKPSQYFVVAFNTELGLTHHVDFEKEQLVALYEMTEDKIEFPGGHRLCFNARVMLTPEQSDEVEEYPTLTADWIEDE